MVAPAAIRIPAMANTMPIYLRKKIYLNDTNNVIAVFNSLICKIACTQIQLVLNYLAMYMDGLWYPMTTINVPT